MGKYWVYLNLPNALTVFRIVAAPFLYVCITNALWKWSLFLCFMCGISDYLDGFGARILKKTSSFGEIFDPIADKILVSFLYFALYTTDHIPMILVLVVYLRDLFLVIGSLFVIK